MADTANTYGGVPFPKLPVPNPGMPGMVVPQPPPPVPARPAVQATPPYIPPTPPAVVYAPRVYLPLPALQQQAPPPANPALPDFRQEYAGAVRNLGYYGNQTPPYVPPTPPQPPQTIQLPPPGASIGTKAQTIFNMLHATLDALGETPAERQETLRRYGPDIPGMAGAQLGEWAGNQIARLPESVKGFGAEALRLANVPFEKLTEPLLAAQWNRELTPEYDQYVAQRRALAQQAATARRAGDWETYAALQAQSQQLKTKSFEQAIADYPAYRRRTVADQIANVQADIKAAYGPQQQALLDRYRQTAPPGYQLVMAAAFDPLNVADVGLGATFDAARTARAAARLAPTAATVAEVAADMSRAGARGNNIIGRLSPFRLTNQSLANGLVNQTSDLVPRLVEGGGVDLLGAFIRNPDDAAVVAATGGISASKPAKQAAALLQRALGDDPGAELAKIVIAAKKDDIATVADLARTYEEAARSFFPVGDPSLPARIKGNVNNWLSVTFMGYNPGYAFRNAANNLVTALADGVSPFQRTDSIRQLWLRWGQPPVAVKQGIGSAGDVWKSRETAIAAVQSLSEPMRYRDVFKGITGKSPTLQLGQNFERLASERIMAHHVNKFWGQVWPKTVRSWRDDLIKAGLDYQQAEYYSRRMAGAMNPAELRAVMGPPSPRPPAAGAAPTMGPTAPAAADLARTVPPDVLDALQATNDPGLVNAVQDAVSAADNPAQAAAAVDVVQQIAEQAVDAERAIGEITAAATSAPITDRTAARDFFLRLRTIEQDFITEHRQRTQQVWQQARGMRRDQADMLWEQYWQTTKQQLDRFYTTINDAEETVGQQMGMTAQAITRAQDYRRFTVAHKDAYIKKLRETWGKSRAAKPEARDVIWDEFYKWSDQHYALKATRDIAWTEQRITDVEEALWNLGQKGAPSAHAAGPAPDTGPAPTPREPVTGPTAPAAVIANGFQGLTEGIKLGAANKAAEYARRIIAGEPAEDVLQGIGPQMRAKVREQIDNLSNSDVGALRQSGFPAAASGSGTPPTPPVRRDLPPPAEPSAPVAPTGPTPPPIPPTAPAIGPSKQAILDAARYADIPTATGQGYAFDKAVLNFARKYVDPQLASLDNLTPEQGQQLLDALHARPMRKAEQATARAAARPAGPVAELLQEVQQATNPTVRVADISVDPARFQFKGDAKGTKTGTTSQFANQKTWKPELGKGISLWVDPADGKTYVINGHHRLELAQRLKAEVIEAPYYIQAATAEDAYLIGALQNIAEGRGTAVDAAEVFRQAQMGPQVLADAGLTLSESNVRKGLALANLNDTLYRSVVNKQFPIERAVIIGERVPDKNMQLQLVRELDKQLARGRKVTDDMVSELADAMTQGPAATYEQTTLFGIEAITQSNAFERAEFLAYVRDRLQNERRLFGFAAKNAEELARVGNIERAAAQGISQEADALLNLFDTVKNQRGPISDIANEAAQAIAKGERHAKEQYYARITDALPNSFQRQGAVAAGDIADAGARGTVAGQSGPDLFSLGIVAPGTQQAQAAFDRIAGIFDDLRRHLTAGSQPVAPLTPAQAAALRTFIEQQAIPAMVRDKTLVGNLATTMRNFALGDYSHKRNIHEWLSYIMPWSYWYTFTYWNWAQRLAQHPSMLANYARYRSALHNANQEYYRQITGDPQAEMPEYWDRQIRLDVGGVELWLDLEKTLMPLQALTSDFKARARGAAPGGEFLEALSNYGPALWPPLIWAYAAWLKQNGFAEAAAEWVGYLTPMDRPIKGLSALAREYIPGADQIIPAGGVAPTQLLGPLSNVQGGDIWERRRIGYYLYRLLQDGTITPEQFQEAAYRQTGPAWARAQQAEAVQRAPGNLAGYLLGQGFKPRTDADIQIDRMWKEWGDVWDKRDTLTPDQWRAEMQAFEARYPWAETVRMSRQYEQEDRLGDYAGLVLDRLGIGRERRANLAASGLTDDLLTKFYDGKYSTDLMTPQEKLIFQGAIEQLGGTLPVKPAAELTTQQQASAWHQRIAEQAVNILNARGGTPYTVDQLRASEEGYYAPGIDQKAYLAQHPELAAYWDAKRQATTTYGGVGLLPKLPVILQDAGVGPGEGRLPSDRGVPRDVLRASEDEYYTSEEQLAARAKYGDDILDLQSLYMGLNDAQRRAWRIANPAAYTRLKAYWNDKNPTTSSSGGSNYTPRSYSSSYRRSYYPRTSYSRSYGGYGGSGGGGLPGATPVATDTLGPSGMIGFDASTLQDFEPLYNTVRAIDPAFDQLVQLLFGLNIADLMRRWYAMTPEERAAWQQTHGAEYTRLLRFYTWLTQQRDAGTTGRGTPFARQLGSLPNERPGAPLMPPPVPPTGSSAPILPPVM